MEFCEFCQEIIEKISINVLSRPRAKQQGIRDSVSHCRLCELIQPLLEELGVDPNDRTTMIFVGLERSLSKGHHGLWDAGSYVTLQREFRGSEYPKKLRLAIWCDEGNPAAKLTGSVRLWNPKRDEVVSSITTQPPIFTNDPTEASPLISNWLQMCLSHHAKCLRTLGGLTLTPGDVVDLPTRVLYIESITPQLNVRLLETKGKQGRYCVLSHCWGPENKRPLRTLKSNLKELCISVPPDKIPRTFKEALIITKGIGINYLWIDSLCIVQDDRDEWARESVTMGSLYEKATLMIAASGASDSTIGCCVVQRPNLKPIAVPLIDNENRVVGQCYLSHIARGEEDPKNSVLNTRAWTFQERYMSRRKVFFMPGGIIWECKESMLDERNCYFSSSLHDNADKPWTVLLEEYTATNITQASDWLPALQGIATEIGTTKRHPYRENNSAIPEVDRGRYRFGVWDTSMPTELIWVRRSLSTLCRKVPKIPSWSWVKIEGSKRWCLGFYFVSDVEKTYDTLSITDSGSLNIRGYLGMKSCVGEEAGCWCTAVPVPVKKWILGNTSNVSPEYNFIWAWSALKAPVQMMLQGSKSCRILGFAYFDETPQSDVFFSVLASARRYDNERSKFNPPKKATIQRPLRTVASSVEADVDLREEDVCMYTWEITLGEKFYYALLLQPVHRSLKKFKRVGLGLMYQAAWDAMDKTMKNFEII